MVFKTIIKPLFYRGKLSFLNHCLYYRYIYILQYNMQQKHNISEHNHPSASHIEDLIINEKEELGAILELIKTRETLAENINESYDEQLTLGDRLADKIADFGGSWKFILSFLGFLILWMFVNVALASNAFDQYPFILLNLCLSCVAALQAPVIMMSQKRQEARDRLRAENDYKVNLKAELEIRSLHEKLDHLLLNKWDHLIEIQKIQLSILEQKTPETHHKTTK